MDRYDVLDLIPAIVSRRTAELIFAFLGLSIWMAYDATPPTVLAPLQVVGCPVAVHIAQGLLDEMHDLVVRSNQSAEVEPVEADRPAGC